MPITIGQQPLLGPIVGLTTWTFVMQGWMYATRLPAMSKYGVSGNPATVKQEIREKVPPELEYPADNYNHLMEQPTQFYATALALNALGIDDQLTVGLAWGYVGLRVVHSLVQATSNHIMTRFSVFGTSSLVLAALTGKLIYIINRKY